MKHLFPEKSVLSFNKKASQKITPLHNHIPLKNNSKKLKKSSPSIRKEENCTHSAHVEIDNYPIQLFTRAAIYLEILLRKDFSREFVTRTLCPEPVLEVEKFGQLESNSAHVPNSRHQLIRARHDGRDGKIALVCGNEGRKKSRVSERAGRHVVARTRKRSARV